MSFFETQNLSESLFLHNIIFMVQYLQKVSFYTKWEQNYIAW